MNKSAVIFMISFPIVGCSASHHTEQESRSFIYCIGACISAMYHSEDELDKTEIEEEDDGQSGDI